MTKQDYIAYWTRTAEDSWSTGILLFENKRYVDALFMTHLALEKLLKATWVKDNKEDMPPRIHNLVTDVTQPRRRC